MRVIYIFQTGKKETGVSQKVLHKIRSLKNSGIDIQGFFFSKEINEKYEDPNNPVTWLPLRIEASSARIFSLKPFWFFLYNLDSLNYYRAMIADIDKENPDLIIMRYAPATYGLLYFVKHFKNKIVFEHNTIEPLELQAELAYYPSIWKKFALLSERIFASASLRNSRAFVAVTEEIRSFEQTRAGLKIPSVCISNGTDVQSLPLRREPMFHGDELHLLFLAGDANPWNGMDRLFRSLKVYTGNIKLMVHLAGNLTSDELAEIKSDSLKNKVTHYGYLKGDELNDLFNLCHIGLNSLAPHRKGLKEGSALKVREYISRGLPIVLFAHDPDLKNEPEIEDCVLVLPSNEEGIDWKRLLSFATDILNKKGYADRMRKFAFRKIDYSVKANEYAVFMKQIVKQKT